MEKLTKKRPTWDISRNAVAVPYAQVPLIGLPRRTTWKNGVTGINQSERLAVACPKCDLSLHFERFWSKKPKRLEILVPFCENQCDLSGKWVSIAKKFNSKRPRKRKTTNESRTELQF